MEKVGSCGNSEVRVSTAVVNTRGHVPMDGEQQCKSGNGFLTTGELFHITETLHWWHGMVFDPSGVGLLQT